MKTVVVSVVHPKSYKYFNEYILSIANQTYKNFDLILFTDHVSINSINMKLNKLNKHSHINTKVIDISQYNIPQARCGIIKYVKSKGYDVCIFTDSDDLYHSDYVKEFVSELKNNKIAFTNISLYIEDVGMKIHDYYKSFNIPDEVNEKYIIHKNCIGLGNSGIRLDIELDMPTYPRGIIVVDWWLYTNLLHNKLKAKYINKPLVYYRQHSDNTAGFMNLNEEKILRAIEVKRLHYKNLCSLGRKYKKLHKKYTDLSLKLYNNNNFKEKYIKDVKSKFDNKDYLWWEYAI